MESIKGADDEPEPSAVEEAGIVDVEGAITEVLLTGEEVSMEDLLTGEEVSIEDLLTGEEVSIEDLLTGGFHLLLGGYQPAWAIWYITLVPQSMSCCSSYSFYMNSVVQGRI